MDEHPRISLASAPVWLQMDANGTIKGKLDTGWGIFGITLIAVDKYNNFQFQSATFKIHDSLESVATDGPNENAVAISPNPFSTNTNLSFTLADESLVSVEVYNERGVCMRRVITNEIYPPGIHSVELRADDLGTMTASGAYFCRITVHSPSGKTTTTVRTLIKS